MDALSTDKGELSKLISVARAVPHEIVEAIGSAPKAGRRRWLVLAELMENGQARRAAEPARLGVLVERALTQMSGSSVC